MNLTIAVELINALGLDLPNFKKYIVDDVMYVSVTDVANYIDIQLHLKNSQNS